MKSASRPVVVLGLVGSILDGAGNLRKARNAQRWQRWRPSIDVVSQPNLSVARFELLHSPDHEGFAEVIAEDIKAVSQTTTVRLHSLAMADPWDFPTVYGALDDFAGAYDFRVDDEDYLLHITTGTHVFQICLFLLAESRRIPARLLQASPPRAHVREARRVGQTTIIDIDVSRYESLRQRFVARHASGVSFLKAGIPTKNAAYNALVDELEKVVSSSSAPILLLGATGTGKTQLARRIYERTREARQVRGPFVEVNCATLRGDAAMSTLFGHKKGAFTGAVADREGLLLRARDGVLFLDEVAELGLDEQAMLLRAIEEKRFLPFGADVEVKTTFQLICGTHRNLSARVREGRFREDLLARLDVWRFELPALRARPEDIAPNVDVELERLSAARGLRIVLSRTARSSFVAFATTAPWPGNFRELAASIERMATLCRGGVIDDDDVITETRRKEREWTSSVQAPSPGDLPARLGRSPANHAAPHRPDLAGIDPAAIDDFDLVQLRHVIEVCRRSRSLAEAGRSLFSVSRTKRASSNDSDRLRKYLASFGLTFSDVVGAASSATDAPGPDTTA
jgi:transcriptional regulatory protein RtcR